MRVHIHDLQVQRPVEEYKKHSMLAAAVLCAVELGVFALMFVLLQSLSGLVSNLSDIGKRSPLRRKCLITQPHQDIL